MEWSIHVQCHYRVTYKLDCMRFVVYTRYNSSNYNIIRHRYLKRYGVPIQRSMLNLKSVSNMNNDIKSAQRYHEYGNVSLKYNDNG